LQRAERREHRAENLSSLSTLLYALAMSLPLRITLRLVATIALVWALNAYLPQYILVTGGLPGWIVIGSLLTLMNLLVRPVLNVIALPLHILAAILAFILINGAFTWLVVKIIEQMEPSLVTLSIAGFQGWIVIPVVLGVANWLLKVLLPEKNTKE
jgi:putative membrane protein